MSSCFSVSGLSLVCLWATGFETGGPQNGLDEREVRVKGKNNLTLIVDVLFCNCRRERDYPHGSTRPGET